MSKNDVSNVEERLKKAKAKRDKLLNTKAEYKAHQAAAKKELDKLSEKAQEKGFELKDLPKLREKTKSQLEDKLGELEKHLDRADEALSKYEEQEE